MELLIMFGRKRDINYDDFYADDRDRDISRAPQARAMPHLILLVVFGVATLAAVRATAGAMMFESVLKSLATPCGLLWLMLLVIAYLTTIRRNGIAAVLAWSCWLLLTAAGNTYLASEFVRTLETPYIDQDTTNIDPFDVVLILGGGTSTSPSGIPQLNAGGDRVMTAVRLYHRGTAQRFVCTGTRWQGLIDNELDIHQEQARILEFAGVPPATIVEIKDGTNTRKEIAAFRHWLEKNPAERIGVISSAWHLRRVESLAREMGLDLVPVPCDFLSRRFKPDPNLLVPSSGNLTIVQLALKEYLAEWLKR